MGTLLARWQEFVNEGANDVAPKRKIAIGLRLRLGIAAKTGTDHRSRTTAASPVPLGERSRNCFNVTVDVHNQSFCNSCTVATIYASRQSSSAFMKSFYRFLKQLRWGALNAMNYPPKGESVVNSMSPERVEAMRDELKDLSRLNAAMFRQVFTGEEIERGSFAAQFDKTNPSFDNCEASRGWDIRIEGDFFIVKRIREIIYVIVGDATGHHAYAGGLKVFVAAALHRMFDEFARSRRTPEAATVLQKLERFFFMVGQAALIEDPDNPLRDGANLVIVRIEGGPNAKISYASAGLPVFAMGARVKPAQYGQFYDGKGISFPSTTDTAAPFRPDCGVIDRGGVDFLVVVTDGFRGLKRGPRAAFGRPTNNEILESFGDENVKSTLSTAVAEASPASSEASKLWQTPWWRQQGRSGKTTAFQKHPTTIG
jgi:hypothetical protein